LTHKPILYLGVGQGYGDLDKFDHALFLDSILKDRVYEKAKEGLKIQESLPSNRSRIESFSDIANIDSQTDIVRNEITSKDIDKFVTEKETLGKSTPLEPEPSNIVSQKKLIPNELNDGQKNPKGPISEETSEAKSKKGSFFNKLFKDKKDENYADNSQQHLHVDIRTKKDKNKKDTNGENEGKDVVYLTDDDINDLLK
jgi:hypothetical protein